MRNEAAAADPMEIVRAGGRIRIGIVKYGAFSSFFERTLGAFAKFSAFKSDPAQVEMHDLRASMENGTTHIGAALFATPDRAKHFRFVSTPITIGVNALTFEVCAKEVEDRGALDLQADHRAIRPIVFPTESGDLYAQYVLGYDQWEMMRVRNYDFRDYTDEFLVWYQTWATSDKGKTERIPVIFADELMCLEICQELVRRLTAELSADSLSPVAPRRSQEPIFAESGPPKLLLDYSASDSKLKKGQTLFYPKYSLCICLKREKENHPWTEYVQEAWKIFGEANVGFLTNEYVNLYKLLNNQVLDLERILEESSKRLSAHHQNGANAPALAIIRSWRDALTKQWRSAIDRWLLIRIDPADPDYRDPAWLGYPWSAVIKAATKRVHPPSENLKPSPPSKSNRSKT